MKIIELNTNEYEKLVKKGLVEEDKKIEKIPNNCEYDDTLTYEEVRKHIVHNFNILGNKINELIDKVNSLENKQ